MQHITGSLVALVTPMREDNSICYQSLRELVDWHIASGTCGLVVIGTTGESATLSVAEHVDVIRAVVTHTAGRVPVIGGTGANSTEEAIELTRTAADAGVDACMLVTPYYNKPPQQGLYEHYRAVAEAVPVGQILYNVPSRTAVDMLPETIARLAQIDNIIGLKEAVADPGRMDALVRHCQPALRDGFALLSGDDFTMCDFMQRGAVGCISVTANLVPGLVRELCDLTSAGEYESARALDARIQPLHAALFCTSSPIPVKWALNRMQRIPPGIRLPLVPLEPSLQANMEAAMDALELL